MLAETESVEISLLQGVIFFFFKAQRFGFTFQPGDAIYPRDENGKMIYHETDLCATWEVSKHDIYPHKL